MTMEREHAPGPREETPRPAAAREEGGVQNRLVALAEEVPETEDRPPRGVWLTREMESLGLDYSKEPTEEEIKLQLRLPTPDPEAIATFQDPLLAWTDVEPSERKMYKFVDGYNDEDWTPPTPPRDVFVMSSVKATCPDLVSKYQASGEELSTNGVEVQDVFKSKEEALRKDASDAEEMVVYDHSCLIRVKRRDLAEAREKARDEQMRANRPAPSMRGGRGRGRGRGGDRSRGHPPGNANYERLGDRDRRRDRDRSPASRSSHGLGSSSSSRYSSRDDRGRDCSSSSSRYNSSSREERTRYRSRSPRTSSSSHSSRHDHDRDRGYRSSGDRGHEDSRDRNHQRSREGDISRASSPSSSSGQPQTFREYKEMQARGLLKK